MKVRVQKLVSLLILLSAFISGKVTAVSIDSTTTITSLNGKWLYFSNEYSSFIPYSEKVSPFTTNASIWIDSRHYKQFLHFQSVPNLCLYANNKLINKYSSVSVQNISLGYLNKLLKADQLFITFYEPKGHLPLGNCTILAQPSSILEESKLTIPKVFQPIKLPQKNMDEWSIMILLSIIAIYIILANQASTNFYPLFSLKGFGDSDQEKYNNSAFKIDNAFTLVVLTINVISISYVVYMATRYTQLPNNLSSFLLFPTDEYGKILLVINFILLGAGYLIGKYLLIQIIGNIFNLEKLSPMHFYEFVRFSTILSLAALILGFLSFGAHKISTQEMVLGIEVLVLVFFLARCIKVSILLTNWAKFRTVYLFSYLCATEILPIMIIVHLVINFHGAAGAIE